MYTRILRNYLLRFGWEILFFWLIFIGDSLASPAIDSLPRLWLSNLKFIGVIWLTCRIMLAEEIFHLSGSWQARPISRHTQIIAPFLLLFIILASPLPVKVLIMKQAFHLDLNEAIQELWKRVKSGGVAWLSLALVLRFLGSLLLTKSSPRLREKIWTLLSLSIVALVLPKTLSSSAGNGIGLLSGNSLENTARFGSSIIHQLPDATDFIGKWDVDLYQSNAKLVKTISLGKEALAQERGVFLMNKSLSILNGRLCVNLSYCCLDDQWPRAFLNTVPVLRYSDGTYAAPPEIGDYDWYRIKNSSEFDKGEASWYKTGNDIQIWAFKAEFASPLSLPDFKGNPDDLLHGLQLFFFAEDHSKEPFDAKVRPDPRTLSELFKQFPWSDETWTRTALPLLNAKITEEDRPRILKFLKEDSRLISIVRYKGWTRDAMPIMKQMLHDRVYLDRECLGLLVMEQDPSINQDLVAVALLHRRELLRLETILRNQPEFDWKDYVLKAWKLEKYTNSYSEEPWILALWAAQESDATAFFRIAEEAAKGKDWETKQLAALVDTDEKDIVSYVRQHMKDMQYDAGKKRWFAANAVKSP